MFLVTLEVNYYGVRSEMHSNLSDHRRNGYGRFRLSLKRQRGAQMLLAAGCYLSGSLVKTFDRKEILAVSDVTRKLITAVIKKQVSTTLSLSDYLHIIMSCSVRSILILLSHFQPPSLKHPPIFIYFLRLTFCLFLILATYKAHPIMLEMFAFLRNAGSGVPIVKLQYAMFSSVLQFTAP